MYRKCPGMLLAACAWIAAGFPVAAPAQADTCDVTLMVLGIAQDAGRPQLGHPEDPAWTDRSLVRHAASLALVDTRGEEPRRWLFEATPDVRVQLDMLDRRFPTEAYVGVDGIFLTHAHIGHYTGLMHFGFEAARTDGVPVYAMPELKRFLETNGPWDQLVDYGNIAIVPLADNVSVELADQVSVTPFEVPHRREYAETVGFRIDGPGRRAIFIPDIDSWEAFDEAGTRIEALIAAADLAFLDATFYGDELPDISRFPHPKILDQMDRFDTMAAKDKAKIRFIHLNHSNPALIPGSKEAQTVQARGYAVAAEGEIHCLEAGY